VNKAEKGDILKGRMINRDVNEPADRPWGKKITKWDVEWKEEELYRANQKDTDSSLPVHRK